MKIKSKELKNAIRHLMKYEGRTKKEAQAFIATVYKHQVELDLQRKMPEDGDSSINEKHPKCTCLGICDAQDCSEAMKEAQKATKEGEKHEEASE